VFAASISVSGSAFEVSASQLKGSGFEQFGGMVTEGKGGRPGPAGRCRPAQLHHPGAGPVPVAVSHTVPGGEQEPVASRVVGRPHAVGLGIAHRGRVTVLGAQ
jgi:hypothetical protein